MPSRIRPVETKCFGFNTDPTTGNDVNGDNGCIVDNQIVMNRWLAGIDLVLCSIDAHLVLINGNLILLKESLHTDLGGIAEALAGANINVDTQPIVDAIDAFKTLIDDKTKIHVP